MVVHTLIWLTKVLVWTFLIYNSCRLRLIQKYPLVFAMIFAWMAGELLMRSLESLVGLLSTTYTWAWIAQSLLNDLLTLMVLLRIHTLPAKFSIGDWYLVVLAGVAVGCAFGGGGQVWLPLRFLVAFELMVACWGLAAMIRTLRAKNFRLGWNLRMVLLAVTVPSVFAHLLFNSYLTRVLSYETANRWLIGAGLAAWIILAAGMMEYSPPVFRAEPKTGPNRRPVRERLDGEFRKSESVDDPCIPPSRSY